MRKIKDIIIYVLAPIMYFFRSVFYPVKFCVRDVDDTISELITTRKSIARFGDGETALIRGRNLSFQKCTPELQEALYNVLSSDQQDFMVAIPPVFSISSLQLLKRAERRAWIRDMLFTYPLYRQACKRKIYYSSLVSRLYLPFKVPREVTEQRFYDIQKLWNGKDIAIVEGKYSRLGVGNDLFVNAKSIKRIIGPDKNAFQRIDKLKQSVNQWVNKESLVLLALGPTATVLAYELAQCGYRAIDIGHLDIEYEWFLKKANGKTAVDGKSVGEVSTHIENVEIIDDNYHRQIIEVIE